ncbi:MAG: hypothetical protein ACYTFI_08205, partial [Planctomycetota bacterium]|jgi:YVTN family beta-propeller protein
MMGGGSTKKTGSRKTRKGKKKSTTTGGGAVATTAGGGAATTGGGARTAVTLVPETTSGGGGAATTKVEEPPAATKVEEPPAATKVEEPPATTRVEDPPAVTRVEDPPVTIDSGSVPPATTFEPPELPPIEELKPVKWPSQSGKDALSPVDVVSNRKKVFVAEYTAKQVAMGLALSRDGKRLYVACSEPKGTVEIIDASAGTKVGSIPVGHTPTGLAVSPSGKTVYVCNRFNNSVWVVDVASKTASAKIPVLREPVAAAITPDGRTLFVANHLPAGAADADYAAAAISVIDASSKKVVGTIRLPNGSTGLRGICTSPDGRLAYVTHILARYQLPTTQLERGWMNTNALSVIDASGKKLVNTVLLDDVDLGAANPWGVECTADGKYICVSHAGTHELSVIEASKLHDKLNRVAGGQKVSDVSLTAADVPNDLSFLVGLRRRIQLGGKGPRGLATVGMMVYISQYFSDDLAAVNLEEESPAKQVLAVSLGLKKTTMKAARKGEMLFNDASICFQHWQSCASCHPDVRPDGLNWDLLNDGMGNPKNTKSLLLSHKTPPVMITGVRPKAEVAVRAGIKFILFAVRPEEEAVAIDTFLKSLKPVPSPYLVNGALSDSAKRGKTVFAKAGCASCHPSSLYTNRKKYNIGTGVGMEKTRTFDTPTLVEIWRTGPFLYDGRSVTIMDVLKKDNKSDSHGKTTKLSATDLKDLAEFVLSQ